MIAAGFGGKGGSGLAANVVAEDRRPFVIEALIVVVGEDILGAPLAVDKLCH
jgi:hypothetical protein